MSASASRSSWGGQIVLEQETIMVPLLLLETRIPAKLCPFSFCGLARWSFRHKTCGTLDGRNFLVQEVEASALESLCFLVMLFRAKTKLPCRKAPALNQEPPEGQATTLPHSHRAPTGSPEHAIWPRAHTGLRQAINQSRCLQYWLANWWPLLGWAALIYMGSCSRWLSNHLRACQAIDLLPVRWGTLSILTCFLDRSNQ